MIFDLMDITATEPQTKPGSRKGRPNYDREFRRRLAAAACEPGVSVAKLARDNGINANMLFSWRSRCRAQLQAESTSLIPAAVVHETGAGARGDAGASIRRRPSDTAKWDGRDSDRLRARQGRRRRRRRNAASRTGELAIVISLPTGTRVWLVAGVTDMRCGFQGLAAKVQTALEDNALGGNVFIFRAGAAIS